MPVNQVPLRGFPIHLELLGTKHGISAVLPVPPRNPHPPTVPVAVPAQLLVVRAAERAGIFRRGVSPRGFRRCRRHRGRGKPNLARGAVDHVLPGGEAGIVQGEEGLPAASQVVGGPVPVQPRRAPGHLLVDDYSAEVPPPPLPSLGSVPLRRTVSRRQRLVGEVQVARVVGPRGGDRPAAASLEPGAGLAAREGRVVELEPVDGEVVGKFRGPLLDRGGGAPRPALRVVEGRQSVVRQELRLDRVLPRLVEVELEGPAASARRGGGEAGHDLLSQHPDPDGHPRWVARRGPSASPVFQHVVNFNDVAPPRHRRRSVVIDVPASIRRGIAADDEGERQVVVPVQPSLSPQGEDVPHAPFRVRRLDGPQLRQGRMIFFFFLDHHAVLCPSWIQIVDLPCCRRRYRGRRGGNGCRR
mmetsp:Transcript_51227/g.109043  ORF Transcript_51227/g.109043 Transcript_51227/m.109043 type:complete len:414 (-) Transcript_51227:155-1396(-)